MEHEKHHKMYCPKCGKGFKDKFELSLHMAACPGNRRSLKVRNEEKNPKKVS